MAMPPPQPSGQYTVPVTSPPVKVSPEITTLLFTAAPVTVNTRVFGSACRIVVLDSAPVRLTALLRDRLSV